MSMSSSHVWSQHEPAAAGSSEAGPRDRENGGNAPSEQVGSVATGLGPGAQSGFPANSAVSAELSRQSPEVKNEAKPHVVLPSISDLSGETSQSNRVGSANVGDVPSKDSPSSNARMTILPHQPLRLPSVHSAYASPSVMPAPPSIPANENRSPGNEPNGQKMEALKASMNNGVNTNHQNSAGISLANFDNPLQPSPYQTILPNSNFQVLHPASQHQQQAQPQQAPQQAHDVYYRPLNVKDALSYLEQVKYQFNSRPDVYNHFLDIMKDFKSQAIDTPGVIERVSSLFKGYPNLIQGFNTFLPQGYRIECSANPDEPIRVTTPMGTSSVAGTIEGSVQGLQSQSRDQQLGTKQEQTGATVTQGNEQLATEAVGQTLNAGMSTSNQAQTQLQPQLQVDFQVPLQTPLGQPAQLQSSDPTKKTADVEFSQAINYVNKIKNRFADKPDIYKHFLEILQTYQREQKPINEVYAQVTVLFQNAPDLLDDFKKFLPDSSASGARQQQQQQHQAVALPKQPPIYGFGSYYNEGSPPSSRQNLPPLGSFSPPSNGTIPHPYYRDQQPRPVGLPPVSQVEGHLDQRLSPQHAVGLSNEPLPISNLRSQMGAQSASDLNQIQQQQLHQIPLTEQPVHHQEGQFLDVAVRPEIDLDPSIVPVVPEPTEPIENSLSLIEETSFFDKAKKFIGNKQVYTEFLKILNLFSQDLLETDELVDRVEHYLGGNKELFSWFKNFVGYQDRPKHIENIVHEKHRLDLDLCEACGPSYKKLPKTDTFMPCSGRDEMCWAVLNDEWVGHPVWASEDSGFIAHRKNQYEETLFKIEEERHEYDFYIESNLRTIQTLETIASKISNMSEEEKATFKLPPGLGHTSLTIYKKVIRKVYDKERGFEIIDALHEYPAVAVPVVLKRLKQKDEEWRRAQREWNKVWRELEQKVYFKSLDHLGLTFKQADKKLLTTKQLVSEISSIKSDQTNKRLHWLTPKPKSQLDYDMLDEEVLFDILSLTEVFIDHSSNFSNPDKERLKDLFKVFVSLFFSIPLEEVNNAISRRNNPENKEEIPNDKENGRDSMSSKRSREDELQLSDILQRVKYQKLKNRSADDDFSEASGVDAEPEFEEEEETIKHEAKKPWLLGNLVDEVNAQGLINNRKTFNLIANTNIYVFFRHLTTVYERLNEVRKINDDVTKEINSRKIVQFAKDLNLISQQLKDMGLDFEGADAYEQLLHLCKRLIDGDIEHQWFEESLRQAYNNKAFKLYTIDKVLQSLVKHAHTILTDSKTSEIMMLFEKDRNQVNTSAKNQILYRLQVRSYMSNTENMFRIEFNKQKKHVCIQYVAVDDLTLTEPKSLEDKWKYYVTSYSLSHPTEGILQEELQIPFLEKIVESEDDLGSDAESANEKYSPEGVSKSALKIKIDPETYFLHIEAGSFDVFSRKSINRFPDEADRNSLKRQRNKAKVVKFLDGAKGWKQNLTDVQKQKVLEKLDYVKKHGSLDGYSLKASEESQMATKAQLQEADPKEEFKSTSSNPINKNAAEADDRENDTTADEVDTETPAR